MLSSLNLSTYEGVSERGTLRIKPAKPKGRCVGPANITEGSARDTNRITSFPLHRSVPRTARPNISSIWRTASSISLCRISNSTEQQVKRNFRLPHGLIQAVEKQSVPIAP